MNRRLETSKGDIAGYPDCVKLAGLYSVTIHRAEINDTNEAIKLNPIFAEAFNSRGYALAEKKEMDKAIANYAESIRLDPTNARTYSNRGLAYHQKMTTIELLRI